MGSLIKIVKGDDFEAKKARAHPSVTFEVGRKLCLDIEITDNYLSQVLIDLLYKADEVEGAENLGFKIMTIHPHGGLYERAGVVRRIRELADEIERGTS